MMKRPWMKWYPRDWRHDPRVKMCDASARGVWREIIDLMHEDTDEYGVLVIDGVVPDENAIARLVSLDTSEVRDGLKQLEKHNVFSRRDADNAIYSRRMVRDMDKAERFTEYGKAGGNPALRDKPKDARRVNPKDNPNRSEKDKTKANPKDNPDVGGSHARGSRGQKAEAEERDSKPADTASCPEREAADTPAPGLASGLENQDSEPDRKPEPWITLGQWVLAQTGLDERPRPVPFACVKVWLERWREDQIRDAITAAVRRDSYDPAKIGGGGLKFFEPIIAEFADREDAEARAAIESRFATFTDHEWKTLLTGWAKGERWLTHRGAPPNDPKTLVHGYWLEWLRATYGSIGPGVARPAQTIDIPAMPDFLRRQPKEAAA